MNKQEIAVLKRRIDEQTRLKAMAGQTGTNDPSPDQDVGSPAPGDTAAPPAPGDPGSPGGEPSDADP